MSEVRTITASITFTSVNRTTEKNFTLAHVRKVVKTLGRVPKLGIELPKKLRFTNNKEKLSKNLF